MKSACRADTPHEICAASRRVAKELNAPQGVCQERLEVGEFRKDIGP